MISALFKRSGIYFMGLGASKLITTLTFILLARHFAPNIFGDIILFVTLEQVITAVFDFGLVQWYQKEASHRDKKTLFHEVISARLYTSLLSVLLLGLFLYSTKSFNTTISLLLMIKIIPEGFLSILDGYYLERKEPLNISLKNGTKMLLLLAAFSIYPMTITLSSAVLWLLIGSFVTLILLFPWKKLSSFSLDYPHKAIKTLRSSSHYALLIITSFVYARADSLIIRYMLNSSVLGFYGASYRYLESLALIPTALSHNLFAISAQKKGISIAQLLKITFVLGFLGILISGMLFFSADFLTTILLGPAYEPAVQPLQIFSGVLFLFFINAPLSTVVQSSSYVRAFLPYGIINTCVNVSLNILIVPVFGIGGAAWVMLFTEVSGLCINLWFIKKIYKCKQ